jgi:SAM-dependent methyltransferase
MIPLSGEYYVECNDVFRRTTNQSKQMLAEMRSFAQGRSELRILSVGSGVGLFEIPMLRMLEDRVASFDGVDVNEHACRILQEKLDKEFGTGLDFKVEHRSFQKYRTDHRFEIVLFNHTFEYLSGDRLSWIQKSRDLLVGSGNVLIFSPNRGGINRFYEEVFAPCFSEDLDQLLTHIGMEHSTTAIEGSCDVTLLTGNGEDPDKVRLLSFLTQADCRDLPPAKQRDLADYYLSLSGDETSIIPHPATLFVL